MENFMPLASALGGLLIGVASAMMLVLNGRIAGISGITGGVLKLQSGETVWRALFVAGLLVGGFAYHAFAPDAFAIEIDRSTGALLAAGVLVGIGTQMGNGCTSGHGICGLSRFSPRSLVAVLTFMATAAATVAAVSHFFGGTL
ncbi:MAG: YeeE/YedE family protein [Sandaracinus sp.]|nr:YeeE/YedE family protein [Sandaracinus sp.]